MGFDMYRGRRAPGPGHLAPPAIAPAASGLFIGLLMGLGLVTACGGAGEVEPVNREPAAAGSDVVHTAPAAAGAGEGIESPTEPGAPLMPLAGALPDPRLAELTAALDMGHGRRAGDLLEELGSTAGGPLTPLLHALYGARLDALEGRPLAWSRRIETARVLAPEDGRVYATAAELHAAAGRLETAQRELERGLLACGVTPELERARGVILLSTPGQATEGLAHLIIAAERAPGLPFMDRALSQGYLLVGNARLGEGDAETALDLARLAVGRDPEEGPARRLLADALAALGQFGESITILEALAQAGEPLEEEAGRMCKRAALAAVLREQRGDALALFRRARDWGLSDEALGTGAHMLRDEAGRLLEAGVEAYGGERHGQARELFREALAFDPESLAIRNHLAVALMRAGEAAEAADLWTAVVERAYELDVDLPEPAHINLAATWTRLGRPSSARLALEEYLDRRPNGEWARETRELLNGLGESPAGAGEGSGEAGEGSGEAAG
ncbi:MAG: hypothetical protein CMJ87_02410 [Planctomycetes bacterium]|nr:hypothetical protein [Planctomycetota bacterium]